MLLRAVLSGKIAAIAAKEVAVATSGGIDSSALVLAALDAGKDVTVASFSFPGEDSRSSDFLAAKRLAKKFELDFLPVDLPTNPKDVAGDVRFLIEVWGARKKTAVECLWPFLYLLDAVKAAGLFELVVGSAADGHFALSKKAMIHHRYPKEKFQAFRKVYFANPDAAQVATLTRMGAALAVSVLAPYHSREVFDLYGDNDWDELNKPRQKEAIRREFPELDDLRIARHTNLQLGDSKIAETVGAAAIAAFAPGSKNAVAAYNALARRADGQA